MEVRTAVEAMSCDLLLLQESYSSFKFSSLLEAMLYISHVVDKVEERKGRKEEKSTFFMAICTCELITSASCLCSLHNTHITTVSYTT